MTATIETQLRRIIEALFPLAIPGSVKNSLWTAYQATEGKQTASQEQLLNHIDAAMTFYERVKGRGYAPTNKQIQALLATCGVHVALDRINTNREIIRELEQEESEASRSGECVECGRFSSLLSANGYCEGCVMQAAIDQ